MWKIVLTFFAALLSAGFSGFIFKDATFDIPVNGTNNQEFQYFLSFITDQYNRGSNDTYLHQVTEVVRFQLEFDTMRYNLTANMARSTCRKDSPNTEECVIQTEPALARSYQCKFSVSIQRTNELTWINNTRLEEYQC